MYARVTALPAPAIVASLAADARAMMKTSVPALDARWTGLWFHQFNLGRQLFDLFALALGDNLPHTASEYCYIGPMLPHVYTPNIVSPSSSLLTQKADDIALAQLVLASLADIY